MKFKLILFAAMVGADNPAQAGWQATNWGMSPAQVVTASKGKAMLSKGASGQRISGDSRTVQVEGTHESGIHRFKSSFYFRDDTKLAMIKLELADATQGCRPLAEDMRNVYGKPFEESKSGSMDVVVWHDEAKNNRVILLQIGANYCSLEYQTLKDANTSGL